MFSGIIQGIAIVFHIEDKKNLKSFTMQFPEKILKGLKIGSSVSNNGCCLTVTNIEKKFVTFDVIKETLELTTFNLIKLGDFINIERSIKFNSEIGGHLITGHIITTAKIHKIINKDNIYAIYLELNNIDLMKFIFYKGLVAVDGISLTVGNIIKNRFSVYLIPKTLLDTNIRSKKIGQYVNIEFDRITQTIVNTVENLI